MRVRQFHSCTVQSALWAEDKEKRSITIKDGEVYDYGDESVVTENALLDVYGINASLITYDNKKLAIIE